MKSIWLVPILPFALSGHGLAEEAKPRHPSDPAASGSNVVYQSSFKAYTPFQDQQPESWRQVNDTIGKLRGHIDHIKPLDAPAGQAPAPPRGRASNPSSRPAINPLR
ncbi:MAG: hypothetical protein FJX52_00385 [Alphaproteobacteria bacterium]|nr:hypothetical protein [Alphaproteobacteria bacterium]